MKREYIKRIILPPVIIIVVWLIYIYGQTIGFLNPAWDVVTVFCAATLVFSVLSFPWLTLSRFQHYLNASPEEKIMARCSTIGFFLATLILIIGFWLFVFVIQPGFQT